MGQWPISAGDRSWRQQVCGKDDGASGGEESKGLLGRISGLVAIDDATLLPDGGPMTGRAGIDGSEDAVSQTTWCSGWQD